MPVVAVILALLSVVAWRLAPPSVATAMALLTLLAAGWLGLVRPSSARRLLPVWWGLAAATIAARLIPGLWPCEIGCSAGAAYARLYGIDVLCASGMVFAALAGLSLRCRHRPLRPAVATLAWLTLGACGFYVCLAWQLGLRCPHCLAVHTLAAASLAGLRGALPPWRALGLALLAGLALHAAYPISEATTSATVNRTMPAALDAIRTRGAASAALHGELVLDLHCHHCSASHAELSPLLDSAIAAGRLRLTVRLIAREDAGRAACRVVVAAGAPGPIDFQLALAACLGLPDGSGADAALARLTGLADAATIAAWLANHGADVEALLAADAAQVAALTREARTPLLILRDATGNERQRWSGNLPLSEIAEALR